MNHNNFNITHSNVNSNSPANDILKTAWKDLDFLLDLLSLPYLIFLSGNKNEYFQGNAYTKDLSDLPKIPCKNAVLHLKIIFYNLWVFKAAKARLPLL